VGLALAVQGLAPLQRALKRSAGDVDKFTKRELKDIGNAVRDRARAKVQHKTGRHGESGIRLAPSIKTSVTQRGVSVYSNAPHAAVQDRGGRVGHGAIIQRARASAYMTKAVKDSRGTVEESLVQLGSKIEQEYERS
jgi:hypothetical protein